MMSLSKKPSSPFVFANTPPGCSTCADRSVLGAECLMRLKAAEVFVGSTPGLGVRFSCDNR